MQRYTGARGHTVSATPQGLFVLHLSKEISDKVSSPSFHLRLNEGDRGREGGIVGEGEKGQSV